MGKYDKYTHQETNFIRKNYGKIVAQKIAQKLRRNADCIMAKASKLKLYSNLGRTHFLNKKHKKSTIKLMSKIKQGKNNPLNHFEYL